MKFWKIKPEWEGQTAFLIGGGPSVLGEDITVLRGRNVMVINSSYGIAPFAQFLFAMDTRWLNQHKERLKNYSGRIITVSTTINWKGIKRLRKIAPPGLTGKRNAVTGRRTSTVAAINILIHLGVSRIVLVGIDCGNAPDGKTHHHEPHMWPQKTDCWEEQYRDLNGTVKPLRKRGIEVINTSMNSRLDFWPKMELEKVLNPPASDDAGIPKMESHGKTDSVGRVRSA